MLGLVVAAAVVPTACVLWFMGQAMRNQRLVARQRLTEAYRGQLSAARDQIDAYWRDKAAELTKVDPAAGAGQTFARLVRQGVCDSVVVFDEAGGVAYPTAAPSAGAGSLPTRWHEARHLEYELASPAAGASVYAELAAGARDSHAGALALQACARCLVKAGRTADALKVITGPLADVKYAGALGTDGRLIVPNAQLLALELIGDASAPQYKDVLTPLLARVEDYGEPVMSSTQRLFLMRRLSNGAGGRGFATQTAEAVATECVGAKLWPPQGPGLFRTPLPAVWGLAGPAGQVVALFTADRIRRDIRRRIEAETPLVGASVTLLGPAAARPTATQPARDEPLLALPAGHHMPGWQLTLRLEGADPFASAARHQVAVYLWIGSLVVAVFAVLAGLVARSVSRQMKLTRLKNDLIATVSHELKTPLASMRVLVDTLLEGRVTDQRQAGEYLRLISTENRRLTGLIDNFLTFSRMERNRRAFEFENVAVADVVAAAVEAAGDRFAGPQCRLEVEVVGDLPTISADHDALVTVLLNLLDNAWKYSGQDKRISLRAAVEGDQVCLRVTDNGVGLSRRAGKRIFDRFYQVDRSLSRPAGGCGLGLSIVKFIVTAHGGTIAVDSRTGQGSTFTVKLPANGDSRTAQ